LNLHPRCQRPKALCVTWQAWSPFRRASGLLEDSQSSETRVFLAWSHHLCKGLCENLYSLWPLLDRTAHSGSTQDAGLVLSDP
jgi:hypothetical protein